jgi:hypothetical protein
MSSLERSLQFVEGAMGNTQTILKSIGTVATNGVAAVGEVAAAAVGIPAALSMWAYKKCV